MAKRDNRAVSVSRSAKTRQTANVRFPSKRILPKFSPLKVGQTFEADDNRASTQALKPRPAACEKLARTQTVVVGELRWRVAGCESSSGLACGFGRAVTATRLMSAGNTGKPPVPSRQTAWRTAPPFRSQTTVSGTSVFTTSLYLQTAFPRQTKEACVPIEEFEEI